MSGREACVAEDAGRRASGTVGIGTGGVGTGGGDSIWDERRTGASLGWTLARTIECAAAPAAAPSISDSQRSRADT